MAQQFNKKLLSILVIFSMFWVYGSKAQDSLNADLNQQFQMQSVALYHVSDRGSGESAQVTDQITRYLAQNGRWNYKESYAQRQPLKETQEEIQDPEKYESFLRDPEIVREFQLSTGADGLLGVFLRRKPHEVMVHLELYGGLEGYLLEERKFSVKSPKDPLTKTQSPHLPKTQSVTQRILREIELLEKSYPFHGEVTGRDGLQLTFGGASSDLERDSIVDLVSIQDIQVHPLLNMVTRFQTDKIGQARITGRSDRVAFARLIEEKEPGLVKEPIKAKFNKTASEESRKRSRSLRGLKPESAENKEGQEPRLPSMGSFKIGLQLGTQRRTQTSSAGSANPSFDSFFLGGELLGELWITRHTLVEGELGWVTGSGSLDEVNEDRDLSVQKFAVAGGYRLLPTGSFYGPRLDFKVGYQSFSLSTDPLASSNYGGGSFSGFYFAAKGTLPLYHQLRLTADARFSPLIDYSADAGNPSGSDGSSLGFRFGFFYGLGPAWGLYGNFGVLRHETSVGASGSTEHTQTFLTSGVQFEF
jgi:hypothetical protein